MSKVLDKLRKLLNQKRGEEELGNKAAAEAFALKIQELLIKHKLELSDIESKEEDETNPITYRTVSPEAWGEDHLPQRVLWTEGLASIIAAHFFCRGLALTESNSVIFVGRVSDIEIASKVFCRLMRTGLNICEAELADILLNCSEEALRIATRLGAWGKNEDFRFSFFAGFNASIALRLDKGRRALALNAGSQTALARIEKGVDDYVANEFNPEDAPVDELEKRVMHDIFTMGAKHGAMIDISPDGDNKNNQAKERIHG